MWVDCTRVIGCRIKEKEEDLSCSTMETPIKAIMLMEKLMEKDCIHGRMGRLMMENGPMELKMDMEFGKDWSKTHTLVSGRMANQRDTEYTHGKTETVMKDSGLHGLDTEMELISFVMVISTLASTN